MERIRAQYPVYKDVSDADLAIAIGNNFPVYVERDQAFAGEYKHARRKKTLVAQMHAAQAEGDQLDVPTAMQDAIAAATKNALDLPRGLYASPVAAAGEALGVLPEGTTDQLTDLAKENVEGMTSLAGVATLPAFGASSAAVRPVLQRAAGLAIGGMGTQGVKHSIERIEQAAEQGDPAGVIAGAAEGTVGALVTGAGYGVARKTFAPLTYQATRGGVAVPPVLPIEGNAYVVPGEKGATKQITADARPGVTLEADATVIESVPTGRVAAAAVPETPLQSDAPAAATPDAPTRLTTLRTEITDLVAQIERARPSERNALRRKLGPLVIERDALEASGEIAPATAPLTPKEAEIEAGLARTKAFLDEINATASAPDVPRGTLSSEPGTTPSTPPDAPRKSPEQATTTALIAEGLSGSQVVDLMSGKRSPRAVALESIKQAAERGELDELDGDQLAHYIDEHVMRLEAVMDSLEALKERERPGTTPDAPPDAPAAQGTPVPVAPKPPAPAPSNATSSGVAKSNAQAALEIKTQSPYQRGDYNSYVNSVLSPLVAPADATPLQTFYVGYANFIRSKLRAKHGDAPASVIEQTELPVQGGRAQSALQNEANRIARDAGAVVGRRVEDTLNSFLDTVEDGLLRDAGATLTDIAKFRAKIAETGQMVANLVASASPRIGPTVETFDLGITQKTWGLAHSAVRNAVIAIKPSLADASTIDRLVRDIMTGAFEGVGVRRATPAPSDAALPTAPPGSLFQGVRSGNATGQQGKSGWLTDDVALATKFSKRAGEQGQGRIDVYAPRDLPPLEQMLERERSKPGSNVYSHADLKNIAPIGQLVLEDGAWTYKPATASTAPREPAVSDYLKRVIDRERKRIISEEEGQALLDDAETAGKTPDSVVNEFLDVTYARLPPELRARLDQFIENSVGKGLKPGAAVGTMPDGKPWIAKSWKDIVPYAMQANTWEQLGGTDRGLVAVMEYANLAHGERAATPAPVPALVQPIIDLASKTPGEALLPAPLPADAVDTAVRESVAEAQAVQSVTPAPPEPVAPSPAELTPKQRFAARMAAGKAAARARRTGTAPPASPSSQAMGITPFMLPDAADIAAMRDALKRFFGRFYKRSSKGMPRYPVNMDTTSLFPDLMSWPVREQLATTPNGFGRVPVVGAVLDPRAKNLSHEELVMHTHVHDRQVTRSIALLGIELYRGQIDSAFLRDPETGEITNIGVKLGPAMDRHGQPLSRFPSDFAEEMQRDPTSYVLSPEQQTAFDIMMMILREANALAERHGVDPHSFVDIIDVMGQPAIMMTKVAGKRALDFYFPRPSAGNVNALDPMLPGITGVFSPSKQFYEKGRLYKTEALGVSNGERYVDGFEKRLYIYVNSIYRAISELEAAKHLAEIGERKGSPERRARLLAEHAGALARREMDPEVFEHIQTHPTRSEAVIDARHLEDYIFTDRVAATIDKYRSRDLVTAIQVIDQGNNLFKTSKLGYDFGWLSIQMLPLLMHNPRAYGRIVVNAMRSIVEEDRLSAVLQSDRYLTAMREMAQLGHPFGTLPDLQRGLAAGQLLTRLPGIAGSTTRGMARSFQIALDLSAVELWLAYRDMTPREQWPAVAEMVGNLTFRGRIEELGTRPERAAFERLMFNAPSYYRGAINILAGAMQGDRAGMVARRGLAGIIGAGLLMFYGFAKLVGLSDDEIKRRANPGSSDFAMVPIDPGDGVRRNVGLGGPIRSFMRLYGEIYDAAVRDPKLLFDPGIGDRNPITRWFRSKLAPMPSMTWDWADREDFLGGDVNGWTLLRSNLPIAAQEPTVVDAALTALGFSVFDENARAAAFRHRSEAAQALYGKRYEDLDVTQQFDISNSFKHEFEAAKGRTAAERTKIVTLASQASVKRAVELSESLPANVRTRMSELRVDTTGYDTKVTLGKPGHTVEMTLAPRQLKRYGELISEEYNRVLPPIVFDPALAELSPAHRQDVLNDMMGNAKTIAKIKLFKEINAHAATVASTLSTNSVSMPSGGSNLLTRPLRFDLTEPVPERGAAPAP